MEIDKMCLTVRYNFYYKHSVLQIMNKDWSKTGWSHETDPTFVIATEIINLTSSLNVIIRII